MTFRVYNQHNFDQIGQLKCLSEEQQFAIRVVAQVLPFRVNQHVVDQLIQWDDIPDNPMFRPVFLQPEMLAPEPFARVAALLRSGADKAAVRAVAQEIQGELNPHPAGHSPSIIIRCQILNVSSTHSLRPYRSGPSSVS